MTTVYVTNNQRMVDVSIAAVKDNSVPRTQMNLFLTQMASASQMCGNLMLADLESIKGA